MKCYLSKFHNIHKQEFWTPGAYSPASLGPSTHTNCELKEKLFKNLLQGPGDTLHGGPIKVLAMRTYGTAGSSAAAGLYTDMELSWCVIDGRLHHFLRSKAMSWVWCCFVFFLCVWVGALCCCLVGTLALLIRPDSQIAPIMVSTLSSDRFWQTVIGRARLGPPDDEQIDNNTVPNALSTVPAELSSFLASNFKSLDRWSIIG